MKTLNLDEMTLVSGGNDEGVVVADVEEVADTVVADVEEVATEAKNEITHLVGFVLSKLSFGCCS